MITKMCVFSICVVVGVRRIVVASLRSTLGPFFLFGIFPTFLPLVLRHCAKVQVDRCIDVASANGDEAALWLQGTNLEAIRVSRHGSCGMAT